MSVFRFAVTCGRAPGTTYPEISTHVKFWNKDDKPLRHVAMIAKFLDLDKPWSCNMAEKNKKSTCMTFLCMITLKNITVAHFFLPSLDNANGCLCQERLLRSIRFATIVTWRHTSLYNSARIQNFSLLIRTSTGSLSVISMDCAVFWLRLDIVVSVNQPNRIVGVYKCTVLVRYWQVWFSPSDSFCGIYIQSTKFVTCKSAFSIYIKRMS